MLSAAKSFPFFVAAGERHEWPTGRPPADELEGARALVLGYGEIGRGAAERLRAFGVKVTGVRRTPSEEPDIIGPDAWRPRLEEFDYVLVTAALTPETHHMLSAAEFARMRPSAWLVNVSRGGLVDHDALAEALAAGRPRGAYLDVTDPEPLPAAEHPLWQTPNVLISGHSAGRSPLARSSATRRCFRRIFGAHQSGRAALCESGGLLGGLLNSRCYERGSSINVNRFGYQSPLGVEDAGGSRGVSALPRRAVRRSPGDFHANQRSAASGYHAARGSRGFGCHDGVP